MSKLFLSLLLSASLLGNALLYWNWHKAFVCNKVFVTYFKYGFGINVDLDLLYKDAMTWVNDPKYKELIR